ncbi:hypothetical protein [Candidatus Vondammii sp. HM_W22]|uniref:hypothetical protein n=1 Tax=Candidatus Vondammii sp. HM_W22 TaxID=2687299 RepID=UPI001F137430|nr:hypothetical protein [Candidatus Vondammii sp. HM_W22]
MNIKPEFINGTQIIRAEYEEILYVCLDNFMDIEIPFTVICYCNFQPGECETSVKPGFSDSIDIFRIEVPEMSGTTVDRAIALMEKRSDEIADEILNRVRNGEIAA